MPAQFSSDAEQAPDLTFKPLKDQRLDQFIWQRVAWLLMEDKEEEADALLQEFDLTLPWEDPLS
ncbi:MAG: hypothetical protein CBB80_004820 [Synechococcus sp. TMED20]|nr:MAG: hypothetical protein CBB80_005525 [Synechococcus sp. TMED20]RPF83382.1 MAG: hypothetical protein CBB80_004820 [Synechococcus sp. TMED20]